MRFLQPLEDRRRLDQQVARIGLQRRHLMLRVEAAVVLAELGAVAQVDRDLAVVETLEVERNAHPVGGGGAIVAVEGQHRGLHRGHFLETSDVVDWRRSVARNPGCGNRMSRFGAFEATDETAGSPPRRRFKEVPAGIGERLEEYTLSYRRTAEFNYNLPDDQ